MAGIDTLISVFVVVAFFAFVGSKVYNHEKESLDPLLKKIKGWFIRDEDEEVGPNDEFEIAFRGQVENA